MPEKLMMVAAGRIPEKINRKARRALSDYDQRKIFPRHTRKNGYLSLKVNPRWRLLSKDGGQTWEVMSHSAYNARIER